MILGLGAGWHEPEYRAFGYPFEHRVSRFDGAVTIIRRLLREGDVDFDGTHYQARDCELRPRGPRPQGPPIMIGTTNPTGRPRPRMLGLVAEHADLWNEWLVFWRSWPDAMPPLRATVDAACLAAGRDPATLGRTVAPLVNLPGAGPTAPGEEPLVGTPEELAGAFRAFAWEGIGHLQLLLNPNTAAALEALAPALELLDRG